MNILTEYNDCYVILTTYILDSALEPSYNLSKNLLLLPWILKLMVDMVNDSTPLKRALKKKYLITALNRSIWTKENHKYKKKVIVNMKKELKKSKG